MANAVECQSADPITLWPCTEGLFMHSLEHVAIWLDDDASADQGHAQALDWAFRLNLPLHAVVTSRRLRSRSTGQTAQMEQSDAPVLDGKLKALEIACSQRGIALEMFRSLGDSGIERFLRPHGLCVCVDGAS